jgi:hypothetical protein
VAVKKEVQIDALKKASKMLSSLPIKEPATKTLELALEELKPELEAALEKGYSQSDLVDLLDKQGVPVKAYQLKSLLAATRAAKTE